MRRGYFLLFAICYLLFAVLLWGCGSLGGDSVSAPPDSTITINPETLSVADSREEEDWHTQFFSIYVQNSDGTPLGNVKITISYPWAVPDSSGVVQLYDGDNKVNSPFDAETDDFGVYNLRFDYLSGGGLAYYGDLEVRSGSAYGKATFTLTSE